MKRLSKNMLLSVCAGFVLGALTTAYLGFLFFVPYAAQNRTSVIGQRALDDAQETVTMLYYLRSTDVPGVIYKLENKLDWDIVALVAYSKTGNQAPLEARFPKIISYIQKYRQEYPSMRTDPETMAALSAFTQSNP